MNPLETQRLGDEMPADVLTALGDRYSDLAYISSGATSSVFSAHDAILDKRVAIKVLKYINERDLISFQQEARAAAKLDHINLVSILNFGMTSENRTYLIMGFVDGQSLEQIVREHGPLSMPLALNFLIQICSGLKNAHAKRISHRDLKTSNIMIQGYESSSPLAIVVDFGLAKEHKEQEESVAGIKAAVGSPLYMSPEQAQGRHGDERSDIYGLACIAYRIIADTTPFESEELFDLLRDHISTPAPPISELTERADIPAGLEPCLLRMLEKDPAKRFQTIGEVQDVLLGIQHALHDQASEENTNQQVKVRKPKIRYTVHAPALAMAAVLLSAIAATVVFFQLTAPQTVAQATTPEDESKAPELPIENQINGKQTPPPPQAKSFDEVFKISRDSDFLERRATERHGMPRHADDLKDEDLACVQEPKLRCWAFSLSHTKVTGSGLHYFNRKEIRTLDLSKTNLTAEGYQELFKLKNLTSIGLDGTEVTDKEIEQLAKLPKLKYLALDECKGITDKAMEYLSASKTLEELDLNKTNITPEGIKKLANCAELSRLSLCSTSCNDETIQALMSLDNLKDLKLNSCSEITDKSVDAITKRYGERLLGLGVGDTKVTASSVVYLKRCPRLDWLSYDNVPLGAAEMDIIGGLKKLEQLRLSKLKCSNEDIVRNLRRLKHLGTCLVLYSHLSRESCQKIREGRPGLTFMTDTVTGLPVDAEDTLNLFLESDGQAKLSAETSP